MRYGILRNYHCIYHDQMGNVKVKVLRTCNLSDFSADTQVHFNILLQKICMFQLQT